MTFEEVPNEAVAMLQRQRRVSYRAMQRQSELDDGYLTDLKEAILYAHPESVNDDDRGLSWIGKPPTQVPNAHHETDCESLD